MKTVRTAKPNLRPAHFAVIWKGTVCRAGHERHLPLRPGTICVGNNLPEVKEIRGPRKTGVRVKETKVEGPVRDSRDLHGGAAPP